MSKLNKLLLPLQELLSKTQFRQLKLITSAILAISGRVTMLGMSRWTEKGGSYRTIQRFFLSSVCWKKLNWQLVKSIVQNNDDGVFLIAGDATTVTKSGKDTFGVNRFYSSLFNRPVPAISFQALSLIDTQNRQSWPLIFEQIIKPPKKNCKSRQ